MKKLAIVCCLSSIMIIGTGCADRDIHSKQTQAKLQNMTQQLSTTQHSAMYNVCHPTKGKTCSAMCQAQINNQKFYGVYKKGCLAMGFSSSDCGPSYASIGCPKFCAAACHFTKKSSTQAKTPSKK